MRRRWFDREMAGVIGRLAWPTVVEQALQTVVQYADTAMVGRIGASASAAVGLTVPVMWLVNGPLSAIGIGVLACIARAVGAREVETAKTAAVQSVLLTLFLGIITGAATLAVSPFLPGWLGAEEAIQRDASLYFAITCLPMVFRTGSIVFGAALRAAGDTRTPMLVGVAMNGCNILLNYLLIGPSHTLRLGGIHWEVWGAGLGVTGAAIATAISYVLGGSLMFVALCRHPMLSIRGQKLRLCRPIMRRCVMVGLPVAAERAASCLGQVVFVSLITRLGTVAMAAHSIALTAEQAFYIPGYGMQAAAATLAGNAVGEQDERKLLRMTRAIVCIAVAIMALTGSALFLAPDWMMRLFTSDPSVIAQGAAALRIVALSEPLFAALIILEGVFNGVGDTKHPFLIAVFSMWGIRLVSTWVCVNWLQLGLTAVWCCMVADNVVRCLLLSARYLRGRWRRPLFAAQGQESR